MHTSTAHGDERAGVTLLELVMVMFILAMVVGGGLGVFAALDLEQRQAAGLVKSILRSAQNSAIARQAPATVRIDPAAGRLDAEALRVVGTWHFENRRVHGAFGLDGTADPELFTDDGWIGGALSFANQVGSVASIPVEHDPAFDLARGFVIDCCVRREGVGGGRVLSIGSMCALELGKSGEVRGWFAPIVQRDGRADAGARVSVTSEPGVVPPERWTRIRLSYDRTRLALTVDGLTIAAVEEEALAWRVDGPLLLSSERRPFPGSVDALVVSAVVGEGEAVLPASVRLIADSPDEVRFSPGGGLDRRYHPDPVLLTLEYEDGQRETVFVGMYGTVE